MFMEEIAIHIDLMFVYSNAKSQVRAGFLHPPGLLFGGQLAPVDAHHGAPIRTCWASYDQHGLVFGNLLPGLLPHLIT